MRLRLSMASIAVLLLAAWLVLRHQPPSGPNPYVLQVPASYLSVGQQFQPRLVSLANQASAATDTITLSLWTDGGKRLAGATVTLAPGAAALADPMALPRAGSFLLRAASGRGAAQTITLHAIPDAAVGLGGVLPVAGLGIASGVAEYLRAHSFVLTPADVSKPLPPATRLLIVGQPSGAHAAAQYAWLWQQVADGAKALMLEPPAPSMAAYWPLAPALLATEPDSCGRDAFSPPLTNGLGAASFRALLHPPQQFDYSNDTTVALYHWNGYQIIPRGKGYPECHALVSYRLGDGWVSQTTLPLLQHFQDVRARIYLMNLIMASARRRPGAPASPGLAWVMRQKMKQLAATPAPDPAAVYFRAAPAAIESAPVLAAAVNRTSPPDCFAVPRSQRAGASMTLDLGTPRPIKTLTILAKGAPAYRLDGSHDGRTWATLPSASAVPAGNWQAFRITTTAASGPWQMCQFTAQ